tara:strand:+ start:392 stop:670 length:279 start_codon:yes stop_codon:yes gene_type:complete
MGRFLGSSINKGSGGGGGSVVMEEFTRSSGITTNADNDVTQITLGDTQYKNVAYNTVGLITSFTESINGSDKSWAIDYNTTTWLANSITEVQ